jgi:hypothetical protein
MFTPAVQGVGPANQEHLLFDQRHNCEARLWHRIVQAREIHAAAHAPLVDIAAETGRHLQEDIRIRVREALRECRDKEIPGGRWHCQRHHPRGAGGPSPYVVACLLELAQDRLAALE